MRFEYFEDQIFTDPVEAFGCSFERCRFLGSVTLTNCEITACSFADKVSLTFCEAFRSTFRQQPVIGRHNRLDNETRLDAYHANIPAAQLEAK